MTFISKSNFRIALAFFITNLAVLFYLPAFADELLIQQMDGLGSTNGKIVQQDKYKTGSKCGDNNDCYKIRYLSDGLEVVGYVVKPKDVTSKLSVMIFNRGGNREYFKLTSKHLKFFSLLSSKGYVVLASQYRGNDGGEGEEEFGGEDVNDVLNLIPLAKSLPFTDPDKIVMLGFSRGGMMTMLAVKKGADIKAAAIVGSFLDLVRTYEERGSKMKRVIKQLVGKDKEKWRERSPIYWSEKINVPTLILHGTKDDRVNVKHAKDFADKLAEKGKPHKLVIVEGGDHGLNSHREKRNKQIFDWFSMHLQ